MNGGVESTLSMLCRQHSLMCSVHCAVWLMVLSRDVMSSHL